MRMTKRERRICRWYQKRIRRMEMRAAKQNGKISGRFMKRVVFTMILAAFIFTVTMIHVFVRTGSEPSTLIENVFKFLSVEGGALALIKAVKTVTKRNEKEETERQQEEQTDESEEVSG